MTRVAIESEKNEDNHESLHLSFKIIFKMKLQLVEDHALKRDKRMIVYESNPETYFPLKNAT